MGSGISGNQIAPTSGEELTEGGQEAMASSDIFTISAINVNSLNLSTYRKNKDCRTKIKLRAITEGNYDIILMSKCWMGKKGDGIVKKELDGLGYELHSHSTKRSRGVAIAIKKNPEISILKEIADKEDENYLLLKCKIKGRDILLGVVYGPDEEDFYEKLRDLVKSFNLPTILGGDFKLDGTAPDQGNLDLENRETIPHPVLGGILHEWLNEGEFCDPYREKYTDGRDMSYLGFSGEDKDEEVKDVEDEDKDEEDEDEDEDEDEVVEDVEDEDKDVKSRLDFFIISRSLLKNVMSVVYDQKLSDIVDHKPGKIFDHVEVILSLGMDEHLNRSSGITDPKEANEEATGGCCKCMAECVIL
jgi:exonuclease III